VQTNGVKVGVAQQKRADEEAAKVAEQERIAKELEKRNELVDGGLQVFSKQDLQSKLQAALQDNSDVTEEMLVSDLASLNLETGDTRADLVRALIRALGAALTLKGLLAVAKEQLGAESSTVLLSVLAGFQEAKSKALLESLLAREQLSAETVFEALGGAAQEAKLSGNGLLWLKPLPADLRAALEAALAKGDTGEKLVTLINSTVGEATPAANCAELVLKAALEAVFQDPAAAQVPAVADKLDVYTAPLERLVRGDPSAQVELLFKVQEKWYSAGKAKQVGLALFKKLCQTGMPKVVSVKALMDWKQDTSRKSTSKGHMIIATNSWLTEMEKELPSNQDDDGDEQEEDVPANPNAEFF